MKKRSVPASVPVGSIQITGSLFDPDTFKLTAFDVFLYFYFFINYTNIFNIKS